ncbi:methyltransferase domain-containing protein [Roseomonas sp. PWR1]|uniref:Methyltransferase domain-containing protein n=1 Tax=Roseomonas nitratireducens TaxID=2820810 RepID=A0ABS4AV11_9PROT|nr:methyltransferase domain-containing protein [Neoroseomonas nitratireducens]MBP0465204.1 methyltransferase domain-containing protein [Neoroseomonas nitratireducens]
MAAVVQDAAKAWDRAAAGWDRNTTLIRAWLAEANEAMLDAARIGPGMRVLDVAAGAGDQTIDIAGRVGPTGAVLATDVAPAMVALAENNLRRAGLHWTEARIADAEALDMDGAGFDAAICRLGLMLSQRPLLALQGILRALAPGKRFAALVFSHAEANPCIAITSRIARTYAGLPSDHQPPPGSLLSLGEHGLVSDLLARAGFQGVSVRSLTAPFRVPSCGEYLDFVRCAGSPIMNLLRPLSPKIQERAWDEMARELDQFTTPLGWAGPNELLLCAGERP